MLCMPSTTIDGQVSIGSDQFSIKNAGYNSSLCSFQFHKSLFPTLFPCQKYICLYPNGGFLGEQNLNTSYCCDKDLDMDHQTSSLKAKMERGFSMHELEPHTLGSLHALVSLVHDRVNLSQPVSNSSTEKVGSGEEDEVKPTVVSNLFSLEEDPIANIVWTLEPHTFQDIFLAMAVSLYSFQIIF